MRERTLTSAAEALRPMLFGNVAMPDWPPARDADASGVFGVFVEARDAIRGGDTAKAVALWTTITQTPHLEQRHILQAWTFLRGEGIQPDPTLASSVLGVVVEAPANGGVDVLAGYRDATARYLNFSGSVSVIDGVAEVSPLIEALMVAGQELSDHIGVWDKPALPLLPYGHARLTMLTPGGFRFGQGPEADLRNEALARPVWSAATALLLAIVDHST